jgi:hypothetical protein
LQSENENQIEIGLRVRRGGSDDLSSSCDRLEFRLGNKKAQGNKGGGGDSGRGSDDYKKAMANFMDLATQLNRNFLDQFRQIQGIIHSEVESVEQHDERMMDEDHRRGCDCCDQDPE